MNSPHLAQAGLVDLVAQAGPVVKFVLFLLLFASVLSWAIILMKWRSLKHINHENAKFLNTFWNTRSVEEIYSKSEKHSRSTIAALFQAGFRELKKLSPAEGFHANALELDNINRALMRASNAEISILEKNVSWLATTASATPFIGLFGTVWGIMNSFQNIGVTGAANLAVVAPGISEALIATAAGLGAAIPAVIAYNHFAGQIKRIAVDMDCFTHDFLNILQRNFATKRKEGE